jgi:hypothetical protein
MLDGGSHDTCIVESPGVVERFCGVPGVVRGVPVAVVPKRPNDASGEAVTPDATDTVYSVPFVRPETVPVHTVVQAEEAATVWVTVVPPVTALTR